MDELEQQAFEPLSMEDLDNVGELRFFFFLLMKTDFYQRQSSLIHFKIFKRPKKHYFQLVKFMLTQSSD